jgi:hypothetical protein
MLESNLSTLRDFAGRVMPFGIALSFALKSIRQSLSLENKFDKLMPRSGGLLGR